MMAQTACCTCATLLGAGLRVCPASEKPLPDDMTLDCCGRIICNVCIQRNPRFLSYCPYCQTSGRSPSPLTSRTRHQPSAPEPDHSNPPPYAAVANITTNPSTPPPPYSFSPTHLAPSPTNPEKANPKGSPPEQNSDGADNKPLYTIHHLRHPPHPDPDTLASLSLRYGVPVPLLRRHNRLPPDADYLLFARHTLLIPTAHITTTTRGSPGTPEEGDDAEREAPLTPTSLSLSPHPPEDDASRSRKTAIRRWMVACKEADYDAAVVYLGQSGWDLEDAVCRYWEDVAWEAEHPVPPGGERSSKSCGGKGFGHGRRGGKQAVVGAGGGGGRRLWGWLNG